MRKVLAYLFLIIGLSAIGFGVYFQMKENKKKVVETIDWSLNHDLPEVCSNYKLESYDLNAYNYTKGKVKVPDCLSPNSNSSFVRSFTTKNNELIVVMEIISVDKADTYFDKPIIFGDIRATKKIDGDSLNYDIISKLEKDIYLSVKIKTEGYSITSSFIEDLLDADYSSEEVSFKKTYKEAGKTYGKLSMTDFVSNKLVNLIIEIPEGYSEQDIAQADQKILLSKDVNTYSLELVYNDVKDSCEQFTAKGCFELGSGFFYLINSPAGSIEDFKNYEFK